jgi:hypothetical protein
MPSNSHLTLSSAQHPLISAKASNQILIMVISHTHRSTLLSKT